MVAYFDVLKDCTPLSETVRSYRETFEAYRMYKSVINVKCRATWRKILMHSLWRIVQNVGVYI